MLLRSDVRLLTLTGAPGIGKTRLAIEVASGMLKEFVHGACFVDLSKITDPSLVLATIAQSLGIKEVGNRPLSESLSYALRQRHQLLVLDNFEQVLEAGAQLSDLLADCAKLKLLVTSRAALHLSWEHLFQVQPLELPDSIKVPAAKAVSQYPALALFVVRAQAVKPDFQLNEHNISSVAEICIGLDGLPLAIELAAARSNVFPPRAMLRLLDQRFDLLAAGPRDAPARHQTLREAIGWSYDLLTQEERSLFRRLSVFVGGCTLEAVKDVCKGADPEVGMLEGLISLVDKNLLGQEEQADGEPRFRMSETMREYAVDRLAAEDGDEAEKTHLRHAQYFLDLARRAEPMLWGREQIVWLTRLDREFCNFRAAMAWSVGKNGDPQIGLGIGGTLWHFWDLRSILGEGRRWMSALLSATPVQTPERVKALNVMSYLAYLQGDAAAMLPPLQEALTVGRKLDDAFGLALTLTGIGSFAHLGGDSDRAVPLLEEAIDVGRRAEWKFILQSAIGWLAVVAWSRGERARAMALMEQSLGQARECEDAWGGGHSLFFLGKWALQQGKYRRARALLQESLNLRRKLEDRIGVATCMDELACMAAGQGDWERAVRLLGAAEALRESIGADVLAGWQSDSSHAAGKARAALGEQRFENAWEAGKVMTPDAAIELALGEGEPLHPIELPASASRGWSPLTRREREVAVLVAQGRTNQQISAELVISRRTVDAHIANILEKLGFTSRARVAAWAVGIGLISSESPA